MIQAIALSAAVLCLTGLVLTIRRRGLDLWAFRPLRRPAPARAGGPDETHVLLCVADHFEPMHGGASPDRARARVQTWLDRYPELFGQFRDADGLPPRHTFFFPIDEYDPAHLDGVAQLCRGGFGEVEVHHHHDRDTADALRDRLLRFRRLFRERHGLLAHDKRTGDVKYGFVHGNWALDNSRPDGRWCGVNNELDVLRETGCYADFTLPSAPSRCQTGKINSIYYAVDDPARPKSHDTGTDVGTAPRPDRSLMLIQGPLLLNWSDRTGPGRLVPRIENANLQGNQPPTMARLDLWLRARVQVPSRPDWVFVKVHTHGATEPNQAVVLGRPMADFHAALAARAAAGTKFRYHYVTAREMYNLARAAEAGWAGDVAGARDFELVL